jgi:hypothetical protein
MVRRVMSLCVCVFMLLGATLALAGGVPCGPGSYAPLPGNPCAYWGDAPFPGMCGGVVALPFLVVGSLLGGNTVGPYGPVPGPGYPCAPPLCPPKPYAAPINPPCGPVYGTPYGAGPLANGLLSGVPCLDMFTGLLGSVTYGTGMGLGL